MFPYHTKKLPSKKQKPQTQKKNQQKCPQKKQQT
jgi:hypothetical protein